MDEKPVPPMPSDLLITSEMTEPLVEPRPPGSAGPRVELVLRLAMTECHTWLGIGGRTERVRRPKRMSRQIPLALNDNSSGCCCGGGGPDYLRSCHDCRRLIGRAIKHSLSEEEEYRYLTPADWNKAVPSGVEHDLAEAVLRGGGTKFKVIVDISVRFEFVYCEATALLLACDDKGGGGPAGRSGNDDGDGDGDAPSCSICFEELSYRVTDLPGCTHGFHFWCITEWFYKASTCPVCRRDQLQYLPPDYRNLRGRMAIDSDHLQDYL